MHFANKLRYIGILALPGTRWESTKGHCRREHGTAGHIRDPMPSLIAREVVWLRAPLSETCLAGIGLPTPITIKPRQRRFYLTMGEKARRELAYWAGTVNNECARLA